MTQKRLKLDTDSKYKLYERAVQNPPTDIKFINREFRKFFKTKPLSLREDFGGTGLLTTLWTKQSNKHLGYTIDLDPVPARYGIENHFKKLKPKEQARTHYIEGNVLSRYAFKTDVVVAFNFSYYFFKSRDLLKQYFRKAFEGLKREGLFVIDAFGGTETIIPQVDKTDCGDFFYFWDCVFYNPVNNECRYDIHFKRGRNLYKTVFTYDWRMWTIRELTELLTEVGFDKVVVYWEGDDGEGGGNGQFKPTKKEENCPGWLAYVVGVKN